MDATTESARPDGGRMLAVTGDAMSICESLHREAAAVQAALLSGDARAAVRSFDRCRRLADRVRERFADPVAAPLTRSS